MSYGPPTALIYYFYGWFNNQEVAYIPGAKMFNLWWISYLPKE